MSDYGASMHTRLAVRIAGIEASSVSSAVMSEEGWRNATNNAASNAAAEHVCQVGTVCAVRPSVPPLPMTTGLHDSQIHIELHARMFSEIRNKWLRFDSIVYGALVSANLAGLPQMRWLTWITCLELACWPTPETWLGRT